MIPEALERIKDMLKELVSVMASFLDGKKLAEELTTMYKELRASGFSEEVATEMVREFYKKKLEMAHPLIRLCACSLSP